jgi:NitT/TauT family transport system substrate-binding protein
MSSPLLRLLVLIAALAAVSANAQTKIKVGTVRATVIGGVVGAKERGYFKEAGLEVDINLIDASAGFVPLLATNELNVVEGGISANLFNGITQGLPIRIAYDSASTPINHALMLRTDLANTVKSIRDLKGRIVAVNAPNSIALYEVTRILETVGLTLNDVQIKVIPFAQMAVAFQTKAIDAGLAITPFTALLPRQQLATAFVDSDTTVKPSPVMISASMFNADWAKANPETAQAFFTALLRGIRDYCSAYHGGPWRPELLRLLVANGVATSAELLDSIPWPARNPDGYVFRDSLADVQRWYVSQGLVRAELPLDQIVDDRFAKDANRALGPFRLDAPEDGKAGCGRK